MLRLSQQTGPQNLAQQITHMLSSGGQASAPTGRKLEEEYHSLWFERQACETEIQRLIELRNEIDELDRELSAYRRKHGPDFFGALMKLGRERLSSGRAALQRSLARSDRLQASLFVRLFWFAVEDRRQSQLSADVVMAQSMIAELGLTSFNKDLDSPEELLRTLTKLDRLAAAWGDYIQASEQLNRAPQLESLYRRLNEVHELVVAKGLEVWRHALQSRSGQLTHEDRKNLGDYVATLNLLHQTSLHETGYESSSAKTLSRVFKALTKKISHIFTASAITSLSARGRIPFEPAYFDIVIIDEASQCDIASALPLILRAERVVIIGDPQQLRHITALSAKRDSALMHEHQLSTEPAWSYSQSSLFDLATARCRAEDVVKLVEHHRSAYDIISFSNSHFYNEKLRIATRTSRLKRHGETPGVEWLDVKGSVIAPSGRGALNDIEAKKVAEFIRDLIQVRGYRGSVGVVTPFRKQAIRINDYIHQIDGLNLSESQLLVDTVHGFQGDERDIMIFSPVVSNGITDRTKGFLASQGNIFNVAVTRARSRLIVIGDAQECRDSGVSYLSAFVGHVEKLSKRAQISNPISVDSAEYPPVANSEMVSEWERRFYKSMFAAGLRPIPQYRVDEYSLDFAIIQADRRLAIEVDGEQYHRDWTGDLILADQVRNQRLIEQGWTVLRFWVYQIRDHESDCIARIQRCLI